MPGVTATDPTTPLDHLGFYTLAGAPRSPRDLIDEVHDGERLGLGWVFISERFNIKEVGHAVGRRGRGVDAGCRSPPGRPTTTSATRS